MARRKEAHGGGHGWFVTFADLMGLLVSFFVMLVAFSNQDAKKVQAVAGSMREAFGVQSTVRYSGITENDGLPTRLQLKNAAHIEPDHSSVTPTPDEQGSGFNNDPAFALAAASLRQALQEMPELTEASKHIMIEESKEGLNIDIVDQDGRAMFPEGLEGSLRTHAGAHSKDRRTTQGDAVPDFHHGPHLRIEDVAATEWTVESFNRPRQCGTPDPGGRGLSLRQHLQGCRKSQYRSALSGEPVLGAEPPRNHYFDPRSATGAAGINALGQWTDRCRVAAHVGRQVPLIHRPLLMF